MRLVCGLLVDETNKIPPDVLERARSLTITWLRWSYFGEIIEDTTIEKILFRSDQANYDYCFIQAAGHILPDQWNPMQDQSREFFHRLSKHIESHDFLITGDYSVSSLGAPQLRDRWLLINLAQYRSCYLSAAARDQERTDFLSTILRHKLPISVLDPTTRGLMLDLGPDLTHHPEFLQGLASRAERCTKGVFPWNFESYDDVRDPPPDWRGAVSVLYSVAAGLKPNMILHTHGFENATEVIFFDYSAPALAFRKLLQEDWDGRNYPQFLKSVLCRLPSDTYYYLWPGASLEDADSPETRALWQREIESWGGEESLRAHWESIRNLKHTYIHCNIITEPEGLLDKIANVPNTILWWSNSFQTAFSSCLYTVDEKRAIYEKWIRALATKAPNLLFYGSDHGNSSVNGIYAADYISAYDQADGSPLAERNLHRHVIRF